MAKTFINPSKYIQGAGEKENLQEQKAFLEHVNLPEIYYWSAHALNSTPMACFLSSEEKQKMIEKLEQNIVSVDDKLFKRTSL